MTHHFFLWHTPHERGILTIAARSERVVADGAAPAVVGLANAGAVVRRIVQIKATGVALAHQIGVDCFLFLIQSSTHGRIRNIGVVLTQTWALARTVVGLVERSASET
jgi:hypothetical protein